ncbi:hypothetical protein FSP39_024401, partial [Pinctada imbricata]
YGLLGPSGCGKTTLLRCIIGRLSVDAGQLLVLGAKPGSRGHGVPGSLVGYMPQEIALFNNMTIGETLKYFGMIHGMARPRIQDRTQFLLDFLTLPDKNRIIDSLSGGQKRRASLAVALLQEPELLILDEPTVGVDPILRERIWGHLTEIARHSSGIQTTIIITTHYIEEARQADMVGLMRGGRLLAEENPYTLMSKFNIDSLETIFLKLCHVDQGGSSNDDQCEQVQFKLNQIAVLIGRKYQFYLLIGLFSEPPVTVTNNSRCRCPIGLPSISNIFAQFIKNMTLMKRNIGFLLFQFILPSIQIILFCVCIGGDPTNLNIAIVNNETAGGLGSLFIEKLDTSTINKVIHKDMNAALASVRDGDAWGVIAIGANFTTDLIARYSNISGINNQTIDGSSVHLYLDMTNQQIALTLEQSVAQTFQAFAGVLLQTFHQNPALAQLPVVLEDPIYGSRKPSFTNFMAPGIILSIIFFMATGLTTLAFVIEKKEGLLDRSFVAGMSAFEVMLAHVFTQLFVMIVQVALLLVFVLAVFQVPYRGPLIWVILLALGQGFCGMTLGVIISAVCENETSAIQLALGSVYPMLLLSGIIWPLEAIPEWMRYVSICLPMTYAAEAMRCVLSRGWDILYLPVWRGYLVNTAWAFGLLAIAGFILRVKQ